MRIPLHFTEAIDKEYNKAGLAKFYAAFLKKFLEQHAALCRKQGMDIGILEKKNPSKTDLLYAFAPVIYDVVIFEKFREALPQPLPQVIELLLWEGPKTHDELEQKFKSKIISDKGSYDKESFVDGLYLCLGLKQEYEGYYFGGQTKYTFTFYLPEPIKTHIKSLYPTPEAYRLTPLQEPGKSAFVYTDDQTIVEEFPLLLAYYQQGDLKFSSGGKPQAGSVNKMRKYYNSREFFPDTTKEFASLRSLLIAEALTISAGIDQKTTFVPDMLKIIVDRFAKGNFSVLYSLLFHLKGTGYVKSNYEDRKINRLLVEIIKDLPAGEWFRIDNLIGHIRLNYPPLHIVSEHTAQHYIHLDEVVQSEYGNYTYTNKLHIKPPAYDNAITRPMIKSVFFFFAALGLVDIAYNYPEDENARRINRNYFSVFDGLQYVRLNSLGAYVLGKSTTYEIVKKETSAQIYLEENHLIINFSGEDKIMAVVLEKVAARTGETRYKTDYATLLKDCQNKNDLEKKINLFRSHIEAEPPQIWEDFFSDMLDKYNPLKKKIDYRIYQIPAADKALIALIARDEVLKELVIKAEHYYILVQEKDITVFRSRLEKFGYLMEK